MRGRSAGCSGAATLRGTMPEMRLENTGSIKSDAPSICTSQLAWPIHVSRAGSPGAGAFRRTVRSGFTAGTSALRGLRRRRPVTLSTTAQRNTSEPGFGPDPSRLRKRVMRSLYRTLANLGFRLRCALLRLGEPLLLVDQVEDDA